MAEQRITVGFDSKDLDRLTEAIRRGMGPLLTEALRAGWTRTPKAWTVDPERILGAEPITIVTPDGRSTAGKPSTITTRYLFIDADSQDHWVPSVAQGRARGWRQAFFLPGR
jgi:hypothetical protein